MHSNKSSWNPEDIQDTRQLQIYSLKQVMAALGYVYENGWAGSHPYFYSIDHSNKGRNIISVKTAINLYNGHSVKCVFGRPPEFLTIWSFNDYQIAQAKAARITKSVKLQYCRQTKQIICQDHRVQFVLESYSRLFLKNKYLRGIEMDRAIVYLFEPGDWMYGCEYNPKFHSEKGKYVKVVIGRGWSSREVSDMLKAYYEENFDNLF